MCSLPDTQDFHGSLYKSLCSTDALSFLVSVSICYCFLSSSRYRFMFCAGFLISFIKTDNSEHHLLNYYSQYSLEPSHFFKCCVCIIFYFFPQFFFYPRTCMIFDKKNISFEVIYSYLSIVSFPSHDMDLLITERNSEHSRNRSSKQSVETWTPFLMVCLNKTKAFN